MRPTIDPVGGAETLRPPSLERADRRFRGRFRTRLAAWLIGLSVAISLASGVAYYRQQLRFVRASQTTRGRTLSSNLASQSELGAYSGDRAFLQAPLRRAYGEQDVSFVAIYDREGQAQLARVKPEARVRPQLPTKVLRRLQRQHGRGPPIVRANEDHIDFYAPVLGASDDAEAALFSPTGASDTVLLGVAHIGLSRRPAEAQLRKVVVAGGQLSLATLALGVIVALLLARRISRPILALADGADRVRAGQLGLQLPVERSDELGVLADSFNKMSSTLQQTVGTLAHLNQHLEDEVAKRTRELEERNLALLRQRDKLEEVGRLRSEFLANMTHELRTPLNAVIGYAELIADGIYGDVNEEQEGSLRAIAESGTHLLTLINDILDLSKAESGRMNVDWSKLDLCQLVRDVIDETRPLARKKPYEVTAELPAAELNIISDETKLRQILVNLLANAIKFTDSGSVAIRLRRRSGDVVELAVHDSGVGIANEHQSLIFDAFRQIDGSSTRKHGGTGLGLAISRKLAGLLGGQLTVRSAVGTGSTFTLALPTSAPAPDPGKPDRIDATLQ